MRATIEADLHGVPDVDQSGEVVHAYYDSGRGFWIENDRGGWVVVNEGSLKRHLQRRGFSSKRYEGQTLSAADDMIAHLQVTQDVAYAGPLAGYDAGPMEMCGNRILVTTSPKLITPVPGQWPVLSEFLGNLLGTDPHDQLPYLYGWLKCAYQSLSTKTPKQGQAMTIAGEKDCGKSLLQRLFTVILGDRAAKPYRYLIGATDFNSELFGAEHLMIEDESASTQMPARKRLGFNIKGFTANRLQSCHPKNRPAISLEPFWRLSITLNDSPEDLLVLPPMVEEIADKIILLKAKRAPMPMPTHTPDQQRQFWETMTGELPAFIAFLLEWEIPAHLRCARFGVKAFQHPELLDALAELSSETRLLALIDQVIFAEGGSQMVFKGDAGGSTIAPKTTAWCGTAEQLEQKLFESELSSAAKRLLYWSNAAGTCLGNLAKQEGSRVRARRTGSLRRWEILPPPVEVTP